MNYRLLGGAAAFAVAAAFATAPASAETLTGAEIIKKVDTDSDGTLDIAEVIHAATKVFSAINPDGDTTLESGETKGRLTEADWKSANDDGDDTLEMDEWLSIARKRFQAANTDGDKTIEADELETPAGKALAVMIVK